MMRTIVLETQNPLDLTVDELKSLARSLDLGSEEVKVMVAYEEQRGAGVTLWDVLQFWVPNAEFLRDALYGYLIGQLIEFMRSRRNRKHATGRTIAISVRLPDGTEVETIIDRSGEGSAEVERPTNASQPRRFPSNQLDPADDA